MSTFRFVQRTFQEIFAWKGLDARGKPLPSGVYYCRLRGATARARTKLALVR